MYFGYNMNITKENKENESCQMKLESKNEYDILQNACSIEKDKYQNLYELKKANSDKATMEKYTELIDKLTKCGLENQTNINSKDIISIKTAVNDYYFQKGKHLSEETRRKVKELIYTFDALL